MNKFLVFSVITSMMVCIGLTSCGSDDGDEDGSVTSQLIDKKLGKRLSAVGSYRYYYTDDGRLGYFSDRHGSYHFGYSPNTIEGLPCSYTSQGYLKGISGTVDGATLSATYTYDGSGHLTKVSASLTSRGENYASTVSLTWRDNLLVSIYGKDEDYDGETEIDTYTYTFSYDTSSLDEYYNEYAQYAPTLLQFAGIGDGEMEEALAYVGKLGRGPQSLPTGYEEKWTEDEGGRNLTGSTTRTCSYVFNIDGTLAVAIDGSNRYNYSYESLRDTDDDDYDGYNVRTRSEGVQQFGIFKKLLERRARRNK